MEMPDPACVLASQSVFLRRRQAVPSWIRPELRLLFACPMEIFTQLRTQLRAATKIRPLKSSSEGAVLLFDWLRQRLLLHTDLDGPEIGVHQMRLFGRYTLADGLFHCLIGGEPSFFENFAN